MEMSIEMFITVITAIVTYIMGILAKKFNWMESKYIPVQTFIIGIGVAICYYFFIDNSNIASAIVLAFSSLISGGFYDLTKTNVKGVE